MSNIIVAEKMLRELRDKMYKHIIGVMKNGGSVAIYQCQHCKEYDFTVRPPMTEKEPWTGAKICTSCGQMNMVTTPAKGEIKSFIV